MKHILILMMVIAGFNTRAQLTKQETSKRVTVGSVKDIGYFIADLGYNVDDGDSTYSLMFRNHKYETLIDIQYITFKSEGGTVNQFYDLLINIVTEKEKDYKETITLGDTPIIITKMKSVGISYLQLFTSKGYFNMNKKQIDKLFGR